MATGAQHLWTDPELAGNILTIHPADFAYLLTFAKPEDCSEFEFYQIRQLGRKIIEFDLGRDLELRAMALQGLKNLSPTSHQELHPDSESLRLAPLA
jgi:hypothetical protein